LIKAVRYPVVRRLNAFGVKRRLQKIVGKIGLRPPLKDGKRRHEIPLDHGFRKYFNTMMRRAKVNYLDKEDMMGHTVGLEKHYERYQEDDYERFPEYQKAIPFLTIADEERVKVENSMLRKEKSENKIQKMELEKIKKELANMDEKWVNKFEKIARDLITKGEKGELDFQKQSD